MARFRSPTPQEVADARAASLALIGVVASCSTQEGIWATRDAAAPDKTW